MKLVSHSLEEAKLGLQKIFQQIAKNKKTIILLEGELGAGKTQFIRWFAESLNVPTVQSPTFSVINYYQVKDMTISHVDLYRLENVEQIESSGFWDLFLEENQIICLEWAQRISTVQIPLSWHKWKIKIDFGRVDSERIFQIEKI